MEAILINCNDCAHCVDLHTPSAMDTPGLTNARNKIKSLVTKWLTPTMEELENAFGNKTVSEQAAFIEESFIQ